MKINSIKVNAEGKTRKEVKEEILKQVEESLDLSSIPEEINKKEVNKEEEGPTFVHINVDEIEDKKGYGVTIEMQGRALDLMQMILSASEQAMKQLAERELEEDGE